MQEIAERYIASFNETDAARRRRLLEELFTPDATYTDPHVDLRGPDAIDAFVSQTSRHLGATELDLSWHPVHWLALEHLHLDTTPLRLRFRLACDHG